MSMRAETKRNILLGTGFIVAVVALLLLQAAQTNDCREGSHTVLVLVDFTDALSSEAVSEAKNVIWQKIENAPQLSTIIFKPIIGADQSGQQIPRHAITSCKADKPNFWTAFLGSKKKARENWEAFEKATCGESSPANLTCGDPRRKGGFFADLESGSLTKSVTSPILEQIVDDSRQHITVRPQSWDLVVVTDWKEYGPHLNVHTNSCVSQHPIDIQKVQTFVANKTKPLVVVGNQSRLSTITSLFAVRTSMTNQEADCLENDVAKRFIAESVGYATNAITGEIGIDIARFDRLPRSTP